MIWLLLNDLNDTNTLNEKKINIQNWQGIVQSHF
jgi:hypothetical protein